MSTTIWQAEATDGAPVWAGSEAIEVGFGRGVLSVGPRWISRDGAPVDEEAERCAAGFGSKESQELLAFVEQVREAAARIPGLGSADMEHAEYRRGRLLFPYSTLLVASERAGLRPREVLAAIRGAESVGLTEDGMAVLATLSDGAWLRLLQEGPRGLMREWADADARPSRIIIAVLQAYPERRLADVMDDMVDALRCGHPVSLRAKCRLIEVGAGLIAVRTTESRGRPAPPEVVAEELAEAGYPATAILAAFAGVDGHDAMVAALRKMFPGWRTNRLFADSPLSAYTYALACPLQCCDPEEWERESRIGRRPRPRNYRVVYVPSGSERSRVVKSPFRRKRP